MIRLFLFAFRRALGYTARDFLRLVLLWRSLGHFGAAQKMEACVLAMSVPFDLPSSTSMSDSNSSARPSRDGRGLRGIGTRLRRQRQRGPADSLAFLLSAVLSPYVVIPVGTMGIIYVRAPREFWVWATISLLFSTFLPLVYILVGMWRGTISDVHVMERQQRGGPFVVAIVGGFVAACVLFLLGAPTSVWGLSLIQAVNGLAILGITSFTKISVHVSVLSATVIGATVLHPSVRPFALLWLIPLLIWARARRGRHSVWQGLGGFVVASLITTLTIAALGLSDRLAQLWQRL